MMTRATVTVADEDLRQFVVVLEGVKRFEDAQALAAFIQTLSGGKVIAFAFVQEEAYPGTMTAGMYDHVEQQLKVIFRDTDDGQRAYFFVPAPKDAVFTKDQELDKNYLKKIKEIYEETTGKALAYVNSGLMSHGHYK